METTFYQLVAVSSTKQHTSKILYTSIPTEKEVLIFINNCLQSSLPISEEDLDSFLKDYRISHIEVVLTTLSAVEQLEVVARELQKLEAMMNEMAEKQKGIASVADIRYMKTTAMYLHTLIKNDFVRFPSYSIKDSRYYYECLTHDKYLKNE